MKHKSIIDFFRDLKEIFDNNGIDCWLIYGALLGMVREGELLEWDRDIDIAVWDKSLPNIECALNEFHNKKIKVHFTESGHVTFNRDGEHIRKRYIGGEKEYKGWKKKKDGKNNKI